jgi:hypothetical protein
MIMEEAVTSIPVSLQTLSPQERHNFAYRGPSRKGSVNFGNQAMDEKDSRFQWTPCRGLREWGDDITFAMCAEERDYEFMSK